MTSRRLYIDIALVLLVLLGNAPLVLILELWGAFAFPVFWEAIIAGLLFELLYGTGLWSLPVPFPMLLSAGFVLVVVSLLRRWLR